MRKEVKIAKEWITLGSFLKWTGAAETGGQAKYLLSSGGIKVNNAAEARRGRKLRPGDTVEYSGVTYLIT